jgi:hypothetical protein
MKTLTLITSVLGQSIKLFFANVGGVGLAFNLMVKLLDDYLWTVWATVPL